MRAVAPASTANLGPGFDVFGLALDAHYDTVDVDIDTTRSSDAGTITIQADGNVPQNADTNTAGVVVQRMAKDFDVSDSIHITIQKGVPAGYGMGSSAASAAAAAVAFDGLYDLNLDTQSLVRYSGYGETASAGTVHYDNVAASVCGGFVIVRAEPFGITRIKAPENLYMCVATPHTTVPGQKTKVSRGVIPQMIRLSDMTKNVSCAASIVAGFAKGDMGMICDSMQDVIVEPARRHMIPGFDSVKGRAMRAGAGAVCISGAGPSIISFADDADKMISIENAMKRGFADADISCDTVQCRAAGGAHIV